MNTQKSSSLYGAAVGYNMDDYGGDGVGSMMALMTQHEAEPEMTRLVPISCYNHAPAQSNQCLVCAAAILQISRGNNLNQPADEGGALLVMERFIPQQSVMSADSPMASVKTEEERGVYAHPSFLGHAEEQSPGKPNSNEHEADEFKANIIGHVHYPRLLAAYADCQKVGAPPELVSELNELSEKCQGRNSVASVSIGADPELDQFMEAYCDLFIKFREELTKPFQEAMAFYKKIESQLGLGLGSSSTGPVRSPPLGEDVKRGKRVCISSVEEESKSKEDKSEGDKEMEGAMELELEVDPHVEDRELKDRLLQKYSGYLSSLKQEFLKKRKKGKLPQEARKMLLDWWNTHYKWPYPSESQKLALAKSSGLDQKQINNWFINQRKRHWKPSEEVQFVVMDGPYTYPQSHPHNVTNPMTKTLYMDTMHLRGDETTIYMDC